MTIEMIPLKSLRPSPANPRQRFDEEAIAGLAQSIKTDGLLQNLVAAKPLARKRHYVLISGERRYRALSLLVEKGELPADLKVPVEVREDVSGDDALRIAAVENIQREDLTPLEEANAIAVLAENGAPIEDIAAQTGLAERTIKRRLALLDLSDQVKAALGEASITLAQAEALSLGGHDEQDALLDEVIDGWYADASDIRERLIGNAPCLSSAIFQKEDYKGTFTTDLFGEAQTTYFDDAEQFHDLQRKAAEKLVASYEQESDWAELVEGRFCSFQYREAQEGERGGVVVQITPGGKVEIHERLVRKNIDASVKEAVTSKPKAAYARPVREYFAMHKSAAVQVELLSNRRKAKEIGVANLLLRPSCHECLNYFSRMDEGAAYRDALEAEASAILSLLGAPSDEDALSGLFYLATSQTQAYELVKTLDDEGLDRLFSFLSVIRFGQSDGGELDTNEGSLFNRVAVDIGADMRKHWTPGVWFLGRRSMDQLQKLLRESGLGRVFGNGKGYKKSELVLSMARHFEKLRHAETAEADQQLARDWLPEAMRFPAIDPDAMTEEEGEDIAEAA